MSMTVLSKMRIVESEYFKFKMLVYFLITVVNLNKAPGLYLIIARAIKSLPRKAYRFITTLFNSIIRLRYCPDTLRNQHEEYSYYVGDFL